MSKKIIAIMYDFDKTLITTDMQNYKFIPDLSMSVDDFWKETEDFAKENKVERILAYMYMMIKKSKEKNILLTKEYLSSLGSSLKFFPGVLTWFKRINDYALSFGFTVKHYIISSGLKEVIQGCQIAKEFEEIYGSDFIYKDNIAFFPRVTINYTQKTQYVFRISKGSLDIIDDNKVNIDISEDRRYVKYEHMIYIGDGMTDVAVMQVLKDKGGKSIAVYGDSKNKDSIKKLAQDKRINYFSKADFQSNQALEKYVFLLIEQMVINDKIKQREKMQIDGILNE